MKNFYYYTFIAVALTIPSYQHLDATQKPQSCWQSPLPLFIGIVASVLALITYKWQGNKKAERKQKEKLEKQNRQTECCEQEKQCSLQKEHTRGELHRKTELRRLEKESRQATEKLRLTKQKILKDRHKQQDDYLIKTTVSLPLSHTIKTQREQNRQQEKDEFYHQLDRYSPEKHSQLIQEFEHDQLSRELDFQRKLRQELWKRENPEKGKWQEEALAPLLTIATPRAIAHQLQVNEDNAILALLRAKNWGEKYVQEQFKAFKTMQEENLMFLQTPLPDSFKPRRDDLPKILIEFFEKSLKKAGIDPKHVDYVLDDKAVNPFVTSTGSIKIVMNSEKKPIVTYELYHYSFHIPSSLKEYYTTVLQAALSTGLHEAQHIIHQHVEARHMLYFNNTPSPCQLSRFKTNLTGTQELTADVFSAIYHKDLAQSSLDWLASIAPFEQYTSHEEHPNMSASAQVIHTALKAHENVRHLKSLRKNHEFLNARQRLKKTGRPLP